MLFNKVPSVTVPRAPIKIVINIILIIIIVIIIISIPFLASFLYQ